MAEPRYRRLLRSPELPVRFAKWFATGEAADTPLQYLVDGRDRTLEQYWRIWQSEDPQRRELLTEFLAKVGGWDIGR
jgi:hypothetical protein